MQAVGISLWVDTESDLDAVTAISGSGPAYFFYFIELLEAAGVKLGLPQLTAARLARQTALGAATMAHENDVVKLREQVTSRDEAAFLFAHELSHLASNDPEVFRSAYSQIRTRCGHGGCDYQVELTTLKKELERAADGNAHNLMNLAGFDTQGAIGFFENVEKQQPMFLIRWLYTLPRHDSPEFRKFNQELIRHELQR